MAILPNDDLAQSAIGFVRLRSDSLNQHKRMEDVSFISDLYADGDYEADSFLGELSDADSPKRNDGQKLTITSCRVVQWTTNGDLIEAVIATINIILHTLLFFTSQQFVTVSAVYIRFSSVIIAIT